MESLNNKAQLNVYLSFRDKKNQSMECLQLTEPTSHPQAWEAQDAMQAVGS